MVDVGCHESGKGIICLDKKNSSAACRKSPDTCGWAKYADVIYKFRTVGVSDCFRVDIPTNAVGINTGRNYVSWLEPADEQKT